MATNGFSGVPWMLAGATHSAELGRLMAHANSFGEGGVVLPTDLKVTARATPVPLVDISPGAVYVPQRSPGVKAQSYLAWAPGTSTVDGPPSSTSARSYLILAVVKDPQYPGGVSYPPEDIASVKNGPYVFPELYGPVPANTTMVEEVAALDGKACYALARLDVPANTTAIAAAHVKDLRQLAGGGRERTLQYGQLMSGNLNDRITNNADYQRWPAEGYSPRIPRWATHFSATVDFSGATRLSGSVAVITRLRFGDFFWGPSSTIEWDSFGDGGDGRETFFVYGEGAIPANKRGTVAELSTQGVRWNINAFPGFIASGIGGLIKWRITFYERVE